MVIEEARVHSNGQLARGIHSMELVAPIIAASVQPGQFVNILIDEGWAPLLRRPMSVASRIDDRIQLIYKVFGIGTQAMVSWEPKHAVNLLGPLGNGWDISADNYPILAGGGVGIAPINYLHEELNRRNIQHHLVMGAQDIEEHYLQHSPSGGMTLCTDNGTVGIKGTVIDGLKTILTREVKDKNSITVYGCGPPGMLEALRRFVTQAGIACQLAVEELMACGFGICQGCPVKVRRKVSSDQPTYHQQFKLACTDGPVFWAHELDGAV